MCRPTILRVFCLLYFQKWKLILVGLLLCYSMLLALYFSLTSNPDQAFWKGKPLWSQKMCSLSPTTSPFTLIQSSFSFFSSLSRCTQRTHLASTNLSWCAIGFRRSFGPISWWALLNLGHPFRLSSKASLTETVLLREQQAFCGRFPPPLSSLLFFLNSDDLLAHNTPLLRRQEPSFLLKPPLSLGSPL